jgi:hypothetical protein
MDVNPQQPIKPWRLDTNNRYRDAVKVVMDLSTASLVVPVFFLRDILRVPQTEPLSQVLNWKIYLSWASLAIAIFSGLVFYYASAKWVRLAWGKESQFFGKKLTDACVERTLEVALDHLRYVRCWHHINHVVRNFF